MSSEVVLDPDSESQLGLHKNWGKVFKLSIHRLSWKTWLFVQKTSNIDLLHTVGKHFLSRVWIQDFYLKMKLCLARICWENLPLLHEKMFRWSGHFCREHRVPLWWGDLEEFAGTKSHCPTHKRMAIYRCELTTLCTRRHTPLPPRFGSCTVGPNIIGIPWAKRTGECRRWVAKSRGSHNCRGWVKDREITCREREKGRERERERAEG